MRATSMRILVVGTILPSTQATLSQLGNHGWDFEVVELLSEAASLLATFRFDIVLASELLPDGRGYDLMASVEGGSGTLLVSVALSESCLWLPVVERGVRTLGARGVHTRMLHAEMSAILMPPAGTPLAADPQMTGILQPERLAPDVAQPLDARGWRKPSVLSMGAGTRNGLSAFRAGDERLPSSARAVRSPQSKGGSDEAAEFGAPARRQAAMRHASRSH